MSTYQKEIVINAPPDKVFGYISDLPRHGEWAKYPLKVDPVSGGPARVGAEYKSVGHMFGTDSHHALRVTEYAPGQRFVWESTSKDGRFRHIFELTPEGGGTRLSKTFDFLQKSFFMKLTTPVIAMMAPRNVQGDLTRIKQIVEGQGAA